MSAAPLSAQLKHELALATARQQQAALPDRSVWVAASAGTGKTSVLTSRVLALLLSGTAPERLLCLTFTKAAAAEMQNRIMRRLGDWAVMPEAALEQALTDLLTRPPEPAELALARRLFGRVLDAPGRLKIQTIHAFCQSLLGRFPLEAGLPPGFQAMDEATADELLLEARNSILARARDSDPQLGLDAALVADRVGEDGLLDLLRRFTAEREQLTRRLRHYGSLDALMEETARQLGTDPDETPEQLAAAHLDRTLTREGALRQAAEALSRGGKSDADRAAALYTLLEQRTADALEGYRDSLLTQKGEIRKILATKPVATAHPEVVSFLEQQAETFVRHSRQMAAAESFRASFALTRLGLAVLEDYQAAKQARAWLDYDDLILRSLDLLRGGIAWVLFKLDGGLDHILIDEAQDTNPEQWEVIRLLADEFFAGQGAERDRPRTLFVVGDAKQSIFSFQRADPVKFGDMRRFFERRISEAGQHFDQIGLHHSFRSAEAVLRLVDRTFQTLAADGVIAPGERLEHRVSRLGQAGRVEIWPLAVKPDAGEEQPWQLPEASASTDRPQRQIARLIARTIRHWITSGETLVSAGRPVRAGDVLILVRRRGSFMADMVKALKAEGVPVAGADRMVLTEQLAVMDLLALARFLLLPGDDLSLACLLKSPLIGLSEDDLFAAAHDRSGDLWAALQERRDEHPALATAVTRLSGWLRRADLERPYEFFASLLGREGGRQALLARLGEEAADPIDEFLNQCLMFERSHTPSLQGFVHWLDSSAQEIKREAEAAARNEVRIMTVHGAKGLQAPIVFLPDTTDVPTLKDKLFWPENAGLPWGPLWAPSDKAADETSALIRSDEKQRQDKEYRRLLYVALTRAEDRLYVLGWQNRTSIPEDCWYNLVAQTALTMLDSGEAIQDTADFSVHGFPGWTGPRWTIDTPQTVAPRPVRPAAGAATIAALPDWLLRPPPEEPVPSRPLAPSRLEEEPPARSPLAADGSGYRRGRLMHRLLQTLPDLPSPRRPAAARRFLASPLHGLSEAEIDLFADEVLAVLDHPQFAALFGPGSRAEVPLTGVLGPLVISGQVDRLCVTPHEVLVVDYKTNRPPPTDPAKVARGYIRQMAAYRGLLRQLYPNRPVRCALLWTDGPFLMELPDLKLDEAEAAIRAPR
jgi:ATP-dependent helicase/nuclease subunit A